MIAIITPIGATIAAFAIIAISLHILFFRRLQLQCPDEWERLGSPNPFLPNDMQTGWRVTKYIMGGHFRHLSLPGVVRLGQILRILEWIWVSGWTIYTALILFVAIPAWLHWIP